MRDVTIETCIKWAYGLQRPQVVGPGLLTSQRYDITAKADSPVLEDQMKPMMQALLADRFRLVFHREDRDMRAYGMVLVKNGAPDGKRLKRASPEEVPLRQNSAMGSVVRALTMQEFADFIAGPLQRPVVDQTGLPGRYDFAFDFTNYLPPTESGQRPDFEGVLNATLQGEVGLKLESEHAVVLVMGRRPRREAIPKLSPSAKVPAPAWCGPGPTQLPV